MNTSAGDPAPAAIRATVTRLVQEVGELNACRILDVSRHTLARVMAGLGVQRGTVSHIRANLGALPDVRRAEG